MRTGPAIELAACLVDLPAKLSANDLPQRIEIEQRNDGRSKNNPVDTSSLIDKLEEDVESYVPIVTAVDCALMEERR